MQHTAQQQCIKAQWYAVGERLTAAAADNGNCDTGGNDSVTSMAPLAADQKSKQLGSGTLH